MPYKDYEKQKQNALNRYYNKREEILKYQKDRLKMKYRTDPEFRKKRALRDKSRKPLRKIKGKCRLCESVWDLQRHHPNYEETYFVILCRACHNLIHKFLKGLGS